MDTFNQKIKFISIFYLLIINSLNIKAVDIHANLTQIPVINRIIISDDTSKVLDFTPSNQNNVTFILEVPILRNETVGLSLKPFYNKTFSASTIEDIKSILVKYLHSKDIKYVTVKDINVADQINGNLRLVVLMSNTPLNHLLLSTNKEFIAPLNYKNNTPSITLAGLPSFYYGEEFVKHISMYIGAPLCTELVNELLADISKFCISRNEYIAGAQIPNQSTDKGDLHIVFETGKYPLKHLVFTKILPNSHLIKQPIIKDSIVSDNVPMCATPEFKKYISSFLGKPITIDMVPKLKDAILLYAKNHGKYLVEVSTPLINLDAGEMQIGVIIGKFDRLHFKGNKYFSDELLKKELGVNSGEDINLNELQSSIEWANKNPFRQIQVQVDTFNKPAGEADLNVAVIEVRPMHLTASYSNGGNSQIGYGNYTFAANIGNLWDLDHQLTYQFSTSGTISLMQAHSFDYKAPLPWRHFIDFSIAYSVVSPKSLYGIQGFNEKGTNEMADLKYMIPFTHEGITGDFSTGVDFKRINTNLEFSDVLEPIASYDIGQISAAITLNKQDLKGAWNLGLNFNYSPGNIDNRNSANYFGYTSTMASTNRSARYEYSTLILERDTYLPKQMIWVSRATAQVSSTNLQGSEQFGIGGQSSVRSYLEHFQGDQGWVLNQELRLPAFNVKVPFTPKKWPVLNTQLFTFFDYGKVTNKHPLASNFYFPPMMSTGLGIRILSAGYCNVLANYGWQLYKTFVNGEPSSHKADIQASFSY
jgi:hemolysin activation/secretion protein